MITKILIYLIVVPILIVIYIRFLEHTTLFKPSRNIVATPQELNLTYEDVYFKTDDKILLNGWFLMNESEVANDSTVIFFHGNAGNIGDRLGKIIFLYEMGLNILVIDYRGYGKSNGKPSEEGLYKDATAAFDYLLMRKEIDHKKIISFGTSLGGAVAVDLASKRDVAALIVDSSFSSAKDMARWIFPIIPSFLIKTKLDSVNKVKNINVPKLFIHSSEDYVVPFELGRKLFIAAKEPKEFVKIIGAHTEAHMDDYNKFADSIEKFLKLNGLK